MVDHKAMSPMTAFQFWPQSSLLALCKEGGGRGGSSQQRPHPPPPLDVKAVQLLQQRLIEVSQK